MCIQIIFSYIFFQISIRCSCSMLYTIFTIKLSPTNLFFIYILYLYVIIFQFSVFKIDVRLYNVVSLGQLILSLHLFRHPMLLLPSVDLVHATLTSRRSSILFISCVHSLFLFNIQSFSSYVLIFWFLLVVYDYFTFKWSF